MAAVALFIVHRSLSRVRHALFWSVAFAATAVRWAIIARLDHPGAHVGEGYGPFGMVAVILLTEGFRLRAEVDRARWLMPLILLVALPIQAAAYLLDSLWLRAVAVPLLVGLSVSWAATTVVARDRRTSLTEFMVIVILMLLATAEFGGVTLALAQQAALIPSRGAYDLVQLILLQPICAALAMSTLMLIAFDFSAEQQRLIHSDPLTGVLNRAGFERVARRAMERRRPRTVSLALTDLDGFKGINDRHGHAVGDDTLVAFVEHLGRWLERDEAVGRFGGEEFALLLPGSDGATAFARIEQIRTDLAGLAVAGHPGLAITASFGVVEQRPGESLSQLVGRADDALYRSKRTGRNRSTLAPRRDEAA